MVSLRYAICSLAGVCVLTSAGMVGAHLYPNNDSGSNDVLPDNRNHWGCWNEGGNVWSWEASVAWGYLISIDGNIGYDFYIDTPCNGSTDVKLDDNFVVNGVRGRWTCEVTNGAGDCDRARVQLNNVQITQSVNSPSGFTYAEESQKTWCHELGHSLGLGHDDSTVANDCMVQGASNLGTYSSHNRDHLWFGY